MWRGMQWKVLGIVSMVVIISKTSKGYISMYLKKIKKSMKSQTQVSHLHPVLYTVTKYYLGSRIPSWVIYV